MARPTGIEPATASFEDSCSIQLSYRRVPPYFIPHGRISPNSLPVRLWKSFHEAVCNVGLSPSVKGFP